jgi:hypothetical protein
MSGPAGFAASIAIKSHTFHVVPKISLGFSSTHIALSPDAAFVDTCDSYTSAMQTIALFGLKMNRFSATVGAALFFILYVSYVACLYHALTEVSIQSMHWYCARPTYMD